MNKDGKKIKTETFYRRKNKSSRHSRFWQEIKEIWQKALGFTHSKLPTFGKVRDCGLYIKRQIDYIYSGQKELFFSNYYGVLNYFKKTLE